MIVILNLLAVPIIIIKVPHSMAEVALLAIIHTQSSEIKSAKRLLFLHGFLRLHVEANNYKFFDYLKTKGN